MTDRELLELAAKAAGLELDYSIRPDGKAFYRSERNAMALADFGWFAPLTDDGDAFRLAVKLRMDMGWVGDQIAANCCCEVGDYAAARRAITRAAAELGRTTK